MPMVTKFLSGKGAAVNNPMTSAAENAAHARLAPDPPTDPVLLALPRPRTDRQPEDDEATAASCLAPIHLIEAENDPRIETALLRELLARSPDLDATLADSTEIQNYHHPLAGVNAYKHRLHAIRCENINLRLRVHELETQLSRMRATRGWRLLEKYRRWRRTVSGWLRPNFKVTNNIV